MKRMDGVVVGIVKEIDAKGGRLKVEYPWMKSSVRSSWAPVASLLGGKGRGAFFMPEIDDEALVAFEHGDFDHPFIVGFLWNGVDTPPEDGTGSKVRRLRTVGGHIVEFDDRPGKERVLIKTKGEQEIELNDTPTASITVKTKGQQKLTLSDMPPGITASVAGGSISISATAAGVIITAPSILSVNVPIAQFSGIVQASAIVAGAYTPAPGNTFGL